MSKSGRRRSKLEHYLLFFLILATYQIPWDSRAGSAMLMEQVVLTGYFTTLIYASLTEGK